MIKIMKKLQYDIKISALSSGEIHKYECFTGEDILPANQQQITEQGKFTYCPLGKAFVKQIKTFEGQGKKQVKALKDHKKKLVNTNVNDDYEDKLLHSREREILRNTYNKKLDKIEDLSSKIDGNNLIFTIISTGKTISFCKRYGSLTFLKIKRK